MAGVYPLASVLSSARMKMVKLREELVFVSLTSTITPDGASSRVGGTSGRVGGACW